MGKYLQIQSTPIRLSSSNTQVSPDNPFLAVSYFTPLMQHAVGAMTVQQCKSDLKANCNRLWGWVFALLLWRLWVEDRLAADATSGRGSKVEK